VYVQLRNLFCFAGTMADDWLREPISFGSSAEDTPAPSPLPIAHDSSPFGDDSLGSPPSDMSDQADSPAASPSASASPSAAETKRKRKKMCDLSTEQAVKAREQNRKAARNHRSVRWRSCVLPATCVLGLCNGLATTRTSDPLAHRSSLQLVRQRSSESTQQKTALYQRTQEVFCVLFCLFVCFVWPGLLFCHDPCLMMCDCPGRQLQAMIMAARNTIAVLRPQVVLLYRFGALALQTLRGATPSP
jgi:hypothetical protein